MGGNGTKYSESHLGQKYARMDKAGSTSYFTNDSVYAKPCDEDNDGTGEILLPNNTTTHIDKTGQPGRNKKLH